MISEFGVEKKKRQFIPDRFEIQEWSSIKPYYEDLLQRKITSVESFKRWFRDRSELESILAEDLGWRYIKMTCDTTDEKLRERFNYYINHIEPHIAPFTNKLNEKVLQNSFLKDLNDKGYTILIRTLEKEFKIYREENIPLITEIQTEAQNYGVISGNMTVEIEGKELTLQQGGDRLQSTHRKTREEAYIKIHERRLEDKDKLNHLFSHLVKFRDKVGKNAGFQNFRDYMFSSLGRFDYSPDDCFTFHKSVADGVVPILNELTKERKEKLKVDVLRPWDKNVDPTGKEPLKPFKSGEDLINKTILCFGRLDPYLGKCLSIMKSMGHLDLESRKGKSPGGYNYPLAEIGVPFIFMNATSTVGDLVTILHEGGHAVHSFFTRNLELNDFKNAPSEIAELASMSMELLTMDHWDIFFEREEDLKRAKKNHMEQIIETLPWVATIDKFQHWIYENPQHTLEERKNSWNNIFSMYYDTITDWTGLEEYKNNLWQKQLHLYEVPFYYIEYAIAQLGAIAVWKNYKKDKNKGLHDYMNALKLGYTQSIPEVFEAANIRFDFSKQYIEELLLFVKQELDNL